MTGGALPDELASLMQRYPLPSGWQLADFFLDRVQVASVAVELLGLVARTGHGDTTGSAAERGAVPFERAYFELLERAALLDAIAAPESSYELRSAAGERLGSCARAAVFLESPPGASWGYARSSGVAAGASWQAACDSARLELLERDRVLRSWFGEGAPRPITPDPGGALAALAAVYRVECYAFPANAAASGREPEVVGVFAFPSVEGVPFAFGFGAAWDHSSALRKAERECLQVAGFLSGETIPSEAPSLAPTPAYHQEFYLVPAMQPRLREWLRGSHLRRSSSVEERAPRWSQPCFVDLTPAHLRGEIAIAKALADTELALTFGRGHPRVTRRIAARCGVHPIA